MVANRNARDVSLVIKARDEATKTFDAVTAALKSIAQEGGASQGKLQQLASVMLSLDKAASEVSSKFDTAAESVGRLQTRAAENANKLDQMTKEAQSLARVVALLSTESDKAFIGPRRNGLSEALRSAKGDLTALNREISSLSNAISSDLRNAGGANGPLMQIAATERAIADAAAEAQAQIALQTRARKDLEAQQSRVSPIQQRINSTTGVSRPAASPASDSASILLQADDAYTARQAAAIRNAAAAHKAFEDRVKQGAAEMRNAEAAAQEEADALKRLRAMLDPVAAITAKAGVEQAKLDQWLREGKISATEHAAATKMVGDSAKKAAEDLKQMNANAPKVSLFGLRPYETQNLLFQFNDIVTQLGSGASLSQTLAQQGGQIFQLFQNRIGPSIAAAFSNPYFIGAAVVLGGIVLGVNEVADAAERLRTINATLTFDADGPSHQAAALNESVGALKRYGLSAEDAMAVVKAAFKAGFDDSQITRFGVTAENLAEILGIKVTEAAKQLADGFDGSYDSLVKLNESTNVFTASQMANIKALFLAGDSQRALATAMDIFSAKAQEAADKQRGPWTEAMRSLHGAWLSFKELLADNTWLQAAANGLNNLALAAKGAFDAINKVPTAYDKQQQINQTYLMYQRGVTVGKVGGKDRYVPRPGFEDTPFADRAKELNAMQDEVDKQRAKDAADAAKETARIKAESTNREKNANDALKADGEQRLATEKKITSEADMQAKLAEVRKKAMLEAGRLQPNSSDAARQSYADSVVESERRKLQDQLDSYQKQQAAEKRRRDIAGIDNFNGANLTATAQRFNGFNENNPAQRAGLMDFFRQGGVNVDPQMVAWCAAFVNAVLKTNGLPGTNSLAARSFLDYGNDATKNPQNGDIVVLRRGKDPSQGHVGFFQGFDQKGNVKVLGGNQGNAVGTQSFPASDVLAIRSAPTPSQVAKMEDKRLEKQTEFNTALDAEIQKRRESADALKIDGELTGNKLLDAQKAREISNALNAEREKARKAGIAEDDADFQARLAKLKEQLDREFEMRNQKAREQNNVNDTANITGITDLTNQREQIQRQMEIAQKTGDVNTFGTLQTTLLGINDQLRQMIDNALQALQTLSGPEAEAARAKLEGIKVTTVEANNQFLMTGRQINETFAQGAAGAFDQFAQAVAQGKDVFDSLGDAFLSFASSFLRQIAQMIIQQAIFNAIGGGVGGGAGGLGGTIASFVTGLFKHDGGSLGGGRTRALPAAMFANAVRYHGGGIAGLAPNEVPAVLQRDEEVLTRSDPRHILNGGKNGGGAAAPVVVQPKIVNAIDAGDAMSKGFDSPVGQQAFLNYITANPEAVRSAIGV